MDYTKLAAISNNFAVLKNKIWEKRKLKRNQIGKLKKIKLRKKEKHSQKQRKCIENKLKFN